jgi:hypothetical protein
VRGIGSRIAADGPRGKICHVRTSSVGAAVL